MDFLSLEKVYPFLGKPVITDESLFTLVTYPIDNNHCIGTLTFKKTAYPWLSVNLKSKEDNTIFFMKGYQHKKILTDLKDYVLLQKKTTP
jgi:hypothetical protein